MLASQPGRVKRLGLARLSEAAELHGRHTHIADVCLTDLKAQRSAVYALAVNFGCSPIYVINRDISEVEAMQNSIKAAATAEYQPDLVHVKTPEQAASLAAPAFVCVAAASIADINQSTDRFHRVSCIPDFPPNTPEEKQARAVLGEILGKQEKGAFLEMVGQLS